MQVVDEILESCFAPKIQGHPTIVLSLVYNKFSNSIFAIPDKNYKKAAKLSNGMWEKLCVALGEETSLPVAGIHGNLPKIGDVVENVCMSRKWIITEIINL